MDSEGTVENLLNDLASRKGFDATWTSLDKETRDLIRNKWINIVEETDLNKSDISELLDHRYDHVLIFNRQEMRLSQLTRIDDYSLNQTICVNRNLHNGQTKHIRIRAKIREGNIIYIAGNEAQ